MSEVRVQILGQGGKKHSDLSAALSAGTTLSRESDANRAQCFVAPRRRVRPEREKGER